jgi:hypothetical protein
VGGGLYIFADQHIRSMAFLREAERPSGPADRSLSAPEGLTGLSFLSWILALHAAADETVNSVLDGCATVVRMARRCRLSPL